MNRVFRRFLGTNAPKKECYGCRMLDYASPYTHAAVPRPQYLLGSRMGNRYQNLSPYQEHAELITIATYLFRKRNRAPLHSNDPPAQWHMIRDRLGLDPKIPFGDIQALQSFHGPLLPPKLHIEKWVDCIEAPTLEEALQVMGSNPSIPWPAFVVLYTFGRHSRSPIEVYNAVRQYQVILPRIPSHIQPELVTLALRHAQKHLLDLVPVVIRSYLKTTETEAAGTSPQAISPAVLNELLWQIARYGKRWKSSDTSPLSKAQEILVRASGSEKVDAKGIFALAYVTHFTKPQLAREFIDSLKTIVYPRTPPDNAQEFAYTNGPAVIRLLTSETAEEALSVVDQVNTHKPAMWSCAALYLTRNQMLTSEVALRLWTRAVQSNVRMTNLLAELVIGALSSFPAKQKVLSQTLAAGIRLTPSLVAKMAKVKTRQDLDAVVSHFPQFMSNQLVLEQVMASQRFCAPEKIWETYNKLYKGGLPSSLALHTLCRAAWDPKLIWDGMYASQRALAEFKMHVRGVVAPSDDLLRIYPDEHLIYAYLVMVGRSGYHSELVSFLGWLEDLGIAPTKRILLALIHYSPQGPTLLKLGQNTRPPASNWPTEEEYELYSKML